MDEIVKKSIKLNRVGWSDQGHHVVSLKVRVNHPDHGYNIIIHDYRADKESRSISQIDIYKSNSYEDIKELVIIEIVALLVNSSWKGDRQVKLCDNKIILNEKHMMDYKNYKRIIALHYGSVAHVVLNRIKGVQC